MTSKSLFFKLMRENTRRRLWTVVLTCLAFFFLFIVCAAMMVSTCDGSLSASLPAGDSTAMLDSCREAVRNSFLSWAVARNHYLVIVVTLAAVICGASGFSYLHSKIKTDFYHSVPVKRELLFFIVYINGILYTAVPYLVSLLLASLLIQIKTGLAFPWGQILLSFGVNMAFYILLYSTVVLAFMMTGNVLVGLLGTGVFFFWGPAILILKKAYYSVYYLTYYNSFDLQEKAPGGSPLTFYASYGKSGAEVNALWAIAAAVLVTAIALFLYKRRPSESAGRAMAFKKSEAPIKCLLVIPIALGGALLFHSMKGSDGWNVFGLICGLLISYGVIEMIYHFDIRKLFSHRIQLALCAICSAVILVFFRFDLSGYDSYLPAQAKIESAGVGSQTLMSDVNYAEVKLVEQSASRHGLNYEIMSDEDAAAKMKLTDISDVLSIAKQGIEDTLPDKPADSHYRSGETIRNDSVTIQYHMKNGRNVTRMYSLDLAQAEPALGAVYDSKEFKRTVYPVLDLTEDDIDGINYQELGEARHIILPDSSMKGALLRTYQQELLSLTLEDRKKETIVGALQFKTDDLQNTIEVLRRENSSMDSLNRICYYPIYSSFDKTKALLKECGIDVGSQLTSASLTKIEITDEKTEPEELLTVTDPVKMQKILDCAVYTTPYMKNALRRPVPSITIQAYAKGDGRGNEKLYYLSFDKDRVPGFVKEAFID